MIYRTVVRSAMIFAISVGGFVMAEDEKKVSTGSENDGGQTYRAKQIVGSKVSIEGDVAIGTVEDIVFNDEGYLEYLIVNNDKKLVSVPWEAAKFNFEKRTAVVKISQERFKEIPTYTVEKYPSFATPNYRTETYKYYGLKPGQERRAIRRGAASQ